MLPSLLLISLAVFVDVFINEFLQTLCDRLGLHLYRMRRIETVPCNISCSTFNNLSRLSYQTPEKFLI